MHSRIIAIVAACLLLLTSLATATAQDATPAASPFTDLGLPTLDVTLTDAGYEGIPDEIAAGRYLVTLTSDVGEATLAFLQPTDMAPETFLERFASVGEPPDTMASPTADDPFAAMLASYHAAVMAGGVTATADQPGQGVLDLTPGEWIAWSEDPTQPEPVIFSVTGEMPTDLPEPASSATITLGEYVIEVTEGELTTGTQVVKVENIGAQSHFVEFAKAPNGMTQAEAEQVVGYFMTGTPAPDMTITPEEDLTLLMYTATQSRGTTQWITLTLPEAGTYWTACWVPDIGDAAPHATHGMVHMIEVGG